jgi:hypothetical protein
MKSMVALWYLTEGRHLPEAKVARRTLGEWETEYSYRHMLRLLRRLTIPGQHLVRQVENRHFRAEKAERRRLLPATPGQAEHPPPLHISQAVQGIDPASRVRRIQIQPGP